MTSVEQIMARQEESFEKLKEGYMTDLLAYYHSQMSGTDEEKEVYRVEAEKSREKINNFYHSSIKEILEGVKQHYEQLPVFQEKYIDKSIGSPKIEKADIINPLEEIIKQLK